MLNFVVINKYGILILILFDISICGLAVCHFEYFVLISFIL